MTRQRSEKPLRSASQSASRGGSRESGRGSIAQPATRAELADAVEAVNAAFAALPAEGQDAVDTAATDPLEAEVDAAIQAGDRPRARAAIRAWRQHWLAEIEGARP